MTIKERFLNTLDGVLLALAMLWTLTIATALVHPGATDASHPTELHAPITGTTSDL